MLTVGRYHETVFARGFAHLSYGLSQGIFIASLNHNTFSLTIHHFGHKETESYLKKHRQSFILKAVLNFVFKIYCIVVFSPFHNESENKSCTFYFF